MILLRLISWPYFRKHVLRTVLTTAGIVLGVAAIVGMRTASQSVLAAFSQTVDRIAGKTELQVTAGETGFGEDILDKVQGASTVRVAVPVIEAIVDSGIGGQGHLLVLGVDMTGDRSLREYDFEDDDDIVIDDPLIFLAQPDSLILSREFATRNHFGTGSKARLVSVDGEKTFTVRGIMKSSGFASAFGGNLAVMDIYAAQKTFGRGRRFDRIELTVKSGVTIADCERELKALLGPAFEVRPPSARGQQFEAMIAGYSIMVGLSSVFALLIGMFIIYNSFSIAVTQRRSEIGILRSLGATRGQIRWLFLGESVVMGSFGSMVGLLAGLFSARAIVSSVAALISDAYGVAPPAEVMTMSPVLLAASFVTGVATSALAAAIPARTAARVDPVLALQKGKYQVLSAGENRVRVVAAAATAVVSIGCLAFSESRPIFYAGYVLAMLAVLLVGPQLSLGLARLLRPALKRLRPIEGALAADSLIQAPRRTSASVTALMLSLALVVAFEGMAGASYRSIVSWMNTTLNPDLFIVPSTNTQSVRFPGPMLAEIVALPGVERVQTLRNVRTTFRQLEVTVVAIEMSSVAQTDGRDPVEGNAGDMYRRAAAGNGLLVSDNLAQLQHLKLGEVLEIAAPYGLVRLPIVGIVLDYTDQQGAILMDRSLFMKYWHDDSVNMFRVYVKHGLPVADMRDRILQRYAGQRQVFVLTNSELKGNILKIATQWFDMTFIQIAIAVLVAMLGIVNTMTVSITDRRRELGVLRAVGASHGQVRRTIWIEALAVATVGLILGYVMGAINLYYLLEIVRRDIVGMRLDYQFPLTMAIAVAPIILIAALVAALWPAESAVRESLVEALEYE